MPRLEKSTTGRTYAALAPRWWRAAAGALSAAGPGPAAAWAARRFVRTPPRARAEPPSGADAFAIPAGGREVRGWCLGEGPAVALVHGWGGSAAQLVPLAIALREAGCAAVAFDAPGHGRSAGRRATLVDFARALQAVRAAFPRRAIVAHSLGAPAAAWVLGRGLPLHAAVFVAPARTPEAYVDGFCAALGLGPEVARRMRDRLERRAGVRLRELDALEGAPAQRTPLLVVHDRADREAPFEGGAALARAWPGAELVATEGLGHRRVLRDPGVARAAAAFVVARLPRCACGRLAAGPAGDARCGGCALADDLRDRRP
jgi:pimeloyl-ACP methyl ester carboxylesterase